MTDEELGRLNYTAYVQAVGGKTWDGKDCPTWDALTEKIRGAWCAGAIQIKDTVLAEADPDPWPDPWPDPTWNGGEG